MYGKKFIRVMVVIVGLGSAATLPACASAGSAGSVASSSDETQRPRIRGNRITAEHMEGMEALSAMSVIRQLKPSWLRKRGKGVPRLMVDGSRDHISQLEIINVSRIASMTLLSPADATTKYGTGFASGLIELVTR